MLGGIVPNALTGREKEHPRSRTGGAVTGRGRELLRGQRNRFCITFTGTQVCDRRQFFCCCSRSGNSTSGIGESQRVVAPSRALVIFSNFLAKSHDSTFQRHPA